jgi:hypothetical protein
MAYDPLPDGDVETAAHRLANFYDQVIAQVTAATRPPGTAMQVIGETDTGLFQAFVPGGTWVPFGGLLAWSTWSLTLTQSATVTHTVTHSRYIRLGNTVIAHCALTVTSAGVANNAVTVTLPVTAAGGAFGFGIGYVRDVSGAILVVGMVNLNTTTTAVLLDASQPANAVVLGQTGSAFAAALASSDSLQFGIIYEAA